MTKYQPDEMLPVYRVGELAFLVEPSWMKEFEHDVIFWEWGQPMQHQVVVGVPAGLDPYEYATGLAASRADMLLVQVRDYRERAVMMNGGWLG